LRPLLGLLMAGRKSRVIVQNPTDQALLCRLGIVNPRQVTLIRGSGVDTDRFAPCPEPAGKPIVMLASRLLWPKGVGVFVEAARQLLRAGVEARFVIVGEGDEENPSSIPRSQLEAWNAEPGIEWWGRQTDMPAIYGQAQIVCLPSHYGEGVPKALIEAASCGRPIVTTDAPGCRDIVEQGINGYLVPVRDSAAVAEAIQRLLGDPDLRLRMGRAGRNRVQKIFSIDRVIAETLAVYGALHGR
jgi:glycosyltransferase involved in cell wall biosynthesis